MTRTLAVVFLAVGSLVLAGPPDLQVPAVVEGEPGAFIPITAVTPGKVVRFVPIDPGLNVFPFGLLADPKMTVASATEEKSYRLLAYTALGDEPSEPKMVTVVVKRKEPPKPPEPPKPVDPLAKAFQAAADADPAADRDLVRDLAGVMRWAADKAGDKTLPTSQELTAAVTAERKAKVQDKLPALRAAVGAYLNSELGVTNVLLDDAYRAKARAAYARVADALGGVR